MRLHWTLNLRLATPQSRKKLKGKVERRQMRKTKVTVEWWYWAAHEQINLTWSLDECGEFLMNFHCMFHATQKLANSHMSRWQRFTQSPSTVQKPNYISPKNVKFAFYSTFLSSFHSFIKLTSSHMKCLLLFWKWRKPFKLNQLKLVDKICWIPYLWWIISQINLSTYLK